MLPINVIDGRPSSRASSTETIDKAKLSEELDSKWILNLSMQFRDDSKQEKLFITYAEKPNFWRRVTVTWDYRHLRRNSMEDDLRTLTLQRDKNMRVYESLRVSLDDIKFFDTVTNLKLKTENDDRLHIYVAEDVDEIIDYPLIDQAEHIRVPRFKESEVLIDAHLSGFVYKVRAGDMVCVKKEIPGPNNVDEFMYELNALNMLREEKGVIDFQGIVTDDSGELIKGLLISFASRGSLAELIYEFNGSLKWSRRKKWAGQIIEALSAVHETGFVQGDFTLSNVVIDEQHDAHIIDLNRRGCPIGWEPPELMEMILSKQKIAMMISTKTDLYQLGMVLYALAQQIDEPDRLEHEELYELDNPSIPAWYRSIVQSCLESDPRKRKSALVLSAMF
ncbi:kinase-like domain-containing protein, partial [Elsinoe ampelina]